MAIKHLPPGGEDYGHKPQGGCFDLGLQQLQHPEFAHNWPPWDVVNHLGSDSNCQVVCHRRTGYHAHHEVQLDTNSLHHWENELTSFKMTFRKVSIFKAAEKHTRSSVFLLFLPTRDDLHASPGTGKTEALCRSETTYCHTPG